jgi:hypothetical protein
MFLSVEPFCVNLPASFKNVLQFVSVIKMFIIFCENGYKTQYIYADFRFDEYNSLQKCIGKILLTGNKVVKLQLSTLFLPKTVCQKFFPFLPNGFRFSIKFLKVFI